MNFKKLTAELLAAVLLAGCTAAASPTDTATEAPAKDLLTSFAENKTMYKSLAIDAFSHKAEDAPTDAELVTMLDFAMATSSAHGLTPAHFVVIRDAEEQAAITSGVAAFGLENPASEGTVTILVLADTLRDEETHADEYNGWYSQMYYGIYDAGAATAYLTLAAQTMGYGVHQIAGLNLVNKTLGEVNVFATGGNFAFVTGENWDVDKYMTSADGTVDFTHHVSQATMTGDSLDVAAYGNLTLLSAIVIGTKSEELDATSGATTAYPDDLANYNFWDPQDGSSYGNSVPATEKAAAGTVEKETLDLSMVADGTYTGSAESTSSKYTVEVTVANGEITSIEVVEGKEDMFAGEEKVNEYINSIIESQNVELDAISGATQDCNGISNAVKEALSK